MLTKHQYYFNRQTIAKKISNLSNTNAENKSSIFYTEKPIVRPPLTPSELYERYVQRPLTSSNTVAIKTNKNRFFDSTDSLWISEVGDEINPADNAIQFWHDMNKRRPQTSEMTNPIFDDDFSSFPQGCFSCERTTQTPDTQLQLSRFNKTKTKKQKIPLLQLGKLDVYTNGSGNGDGSSHDSTYSTVYTNSSFPQKHKVFISSVNAASMRGNSVLNLEAEPPKKSSHIPRPLSPALSQRLRHKSHPKLIPTEEFQRLCDVFAESQDMEQYYNHNIYYCDDLPEEEEIQLQQIQSNQNQTTKNKKPKKRKKTKTKRKITSPKKIKCKLKFKRSVSITPTPNAVPCFKPKLHSSITASLRDTYTHGTSESLTSCTHSKAVKDKLQENLQHAYWTHDPEILVLHGSGGGFDLNQSNSNDLIELPRGMYIGSIKHNLERKGMRTIEFNDNFSARKYIKHLKQHLKQAQSDENENTSNSNNDNNARTPRVLPQSYENHYEYPNMLKPSKPKKKTFKHRRRRCASARASTTPRATNKIHRTHTTRTTTRTGAAHTYHPIPMGLKKKTKTRPSTGKNWSSSSYRKSNSNGYGQPMPEFGCTPRRANHPKINTGKKIHKLAKNFASPKLIQKRVLSTKSGIHIPTGSSRISFGDFDITHVHNSYHKHNIIENDNVDTNSSKITIMVATPPSTSRSCEKHSRSSRSSVLVVADMSKLSRKFIALLKCSRELTKYRFQMLRKMFKLIDTDGSGNASFEEIVKFNVFLNPMKSLLHTRRDAKILFKLADLDRNGFITEIEWLNGWVNNVRLNNHCFFIVDIFIKQFISRTQRNIIVNGHFQQAVKFSVRILRQVLKWRAKALKVRRVTAKRSSAFF